MEAFKKDGGVDNVLTLFEVINAMKEANQTLIGQIQKSIDEEEGEDT